MDPYVDPRTGVLRNRLGTADGAELGRAEARLAAAAEVVLFSEQLKLGAYDLAHLRAVHRHLFGAVYDWAGDLRTVNMTKGETVFALVEWLEPQAQEVVDRLAGVLYLQDLPRERFIEGASQVLSDLNALHPSGRQRSYAASVPPAPWGRRRVGHRLVEDRPVGKCGCLDCVHG